MSSFMLKKYFKLGLIITFFMMIPGVFAAKYDVPIQYTDVATDGKSDSKAAVSDALLENACFAAQDEPFGGVACRPENQFLQQIGSTVTCAKPADLKQLAESQQAKNRKSFNCFTNETSSECRTGWCSDAGNCQRSIASCPTSTRTDICPGGCGGCATGHVYCPDPNGKPQTPPLLMAQPKAPHYPANVPVCQLMDYSPDPGIQASDYVKSCAALGRGVANFCTGECTDCASGFTKSGRNQNQCIPFSQRFIEVLEDGLSALGGPLLDGKYDYSAGHLATVFLRADEALKADHALKADQATKADHALKADQATDADQAKVAVLADSLKWNSGKLPLSMKDLLVDDYALCTSNIQCSSLRCADIGVCYSPGKTSGQCINNSDCELGYECNAQNQCAAWQRKNQSSGTGLWSEKTGNLYYSKGRVGIGIDTPTSDLHVTGNASIGSPNNHAPGAYSLAVGINNAAQGNASIAMGMDNLAGKDQSIALGTNSHSTGQHTVAIGTQAQASGLSAIAVGQGAQAAGKNAIAIGKGAKASGEESVALGNNATVNGWKSVGIGLSGQAFDLQQHQSMAIMGGKVGIGTVTPVSTLHVAGNATIEDLKSCGSIYTSITGQLQCGSGGGSGSPVWTLNSTDAYRDIGYVGIGTAKPNTRLHVEGGLAANLNSPGYVQIGDANAAIVIDNGHIMARNSSSYGSLFLQKFGGNVGIGSEAVAPLHISRGADAGLFQHGYLVIGSTGGTNLVMDDNEILARNNGRASNLYLQLDGGIVQIGRSNSNVAPDALSSGEALRFGVDSNYSWMQSYNNKPLVLNPVGTRVEIGTNNNGYLYVNGELNVSQAVKGAAFEPFIKRKHIYRQSTSTLNKNIDSISCLSDDILIAGGCSTLSSGVGSLKSSYPVFPTSPGGSYSWRCEYDRNTNFMMYAICLSPNDGNIRSSN